MSFFTGVRNEYSQKKVVPKTLCYSEKRGWSCDIERKENPMVQEVRGGERTKSIQPVGAAQGGVLY